MTKRRNKIQSTKQIQGRMGIAATKRTSWPLTSRLQSACNSIEARIPGTPRFRRQIERRLLAASQTRVTEFRGLKSLDHETKIRLSPYVRHSLHLLAKRQEQSDYIIFVILYFIIAVSGSLSFFSAPMLAQPWVTLPHVDSTIIGAARGVSIVAFLLATGFTNVMLWLRRRICGTHDWSDVVGGLLLPTCISFLYLWFGYLVVNGRVGQIPLENQFVIFVGLLGAATFWMGGIVGPVALGVLLLLLARRRVRACYPQAVIIQNLLDSITLLESKPTRWASIDTKRQCLKHIERVAQCFEQYLPKQLSSGDIAMDTQFKQDAYRIATALRHTKRLVYSSTSDDCYSLNQKLTSMLNHVALGNWNSMEQENSANHHLSKTNMMIVWIKNVVQTLCLASVPLLMLLGLFTFSHYRSISLPEVIVYPWLCISALYAFVRIVKAFDPHFPDTIALLKLVIDVIPFIGRNSK